MSITVEHSFIHEQWNAAGLQLTWQSVCFGEDSQVILADFFLGDQLTSQVSSFRNLEFIICYYLGGYFEIRDEDACTQNKTFQGLIYVFSLLPYSFRFWQVMWITCIFNKQVLRFLHLAFCKSLHGLSVKQSWSLVAKLLSFGSGLLIFTVLEEVARWRRYEAAVQRWKVCICDDGCGGQGYIFHEGRYHLACSFHTLFLFCHLLSIVLGYCRRLGAAAKKLQEQVAPRQSHFQEEIHLLCIHGMSRSKLRIELRDFMAFCTFNWSLENAYFFVVEWVCIKQGVNTVLRLAWVSSIQHLNYFPGFSQAGWYNIFASLEVIRRGHWNFNR